MSHRQVPERCHPRPSFGTSILCSHVCRLISPCSNELVYCDRFDGPSPSRRKDEKIANEQITEKLAKTYPMWTSAVAETDMLLRPYSEPFIGHLICNPSLFCHPSASWPAIGCLYTRCCREDRRAKNSARSHFTTDPCWLITRMKDLESLANLTQHAQSSLR